MYVEKGLYSVAAKTCCKRMVIIRNESEGLPEDGGAAYISTDCVDFVWEICKERIDDLDSDIGGGSEEGKIIESAVADLEKELGLYYKWLGNREAGLTSLRALKR